MLNSTSKYLIKSAILHISCLTLLATSPCMAQNVGIGTAAPLEKLHVIGNIRSSTLAGVGSRLVLSDANGTLLNATGATSPAWMTLGNSGLTDGTHFLGTTDSRDLRFRTNNTERITIKNTGAIGLFTNAPVTSWLHCIPPSLANDWQMKWDNTLSADAAGRFQNTLATNGSRVLMGATNYSGSANVASAVIGISLNATTTGTGGVGVYGSANNESGVAVQGNLFFSGTYTGWAGYFNADVFCGGTYFGSDRRLKKDINPITNALDLVDRIAPVSYRYNTEEYPGIGLDENRLSYGFIAQDLEQVMPELVKDKLLDLNANKEQTTDVSDARETGSFKVVNYSLLIPILTQAIKEQQIMINQLKQEVESLKANQK